MNSYIFSIEKDGSVNISTNGMVTEPGDYIDVLCMIRLLIELKHRISNHCLQNNDHVIDAIPCMDGVIAELEHLADFMSEEY